MLRAIMARLSRCFGGWKEIQEQALGPEHPDVARTLEDRARLYYDQGRYAEAEPLLTGRCRFGSRRFDRAPRCG